MSSVPVVLSVASAARAAPYVAALRAVGLERVRVLTPRSPLVAAASGQGASSSHAAHAAHTAAEARAALEGAAGLVLGGGCDVEPWRYGETARPDAEVEVVPGRDELEWDLLAVARAARLPVWGICRGPQVLNVFLGGSLWQDLPSQRPFPPARLPSAPRVRHDLGQPPDTLAHSLRVTAPRTRLGEILGREPALVNSRHHQGIRELAPSLIAVAAAPDGLIEAVALAGGDPTGSTDGWWVRGVQWHPENLVAMAQQRALWEDFAQAVRQRSAASLALAG